MNKDEFIEACDSMKVGALNISPDAIQAPGTLTLHIYMTRGERRIADELRKAFGGFERVIIDVDGEEHEFDADSLIRLLEGYEVALGTRWHELFGTPERAARTLADLQTCSLGFDLECDECAVYSLCKSGARNDRDALLEWLRGDAE